MCVFWCHLFVKRTQKHQNVQLKRTQDFLNNVEDPVAPKIYRLIRAHQLKFTEEPRGKIQQRY